MKFLDDVEVINDKTEYNAKEVYKGMRGTIMDAEIRFNIFIVIFIDERVKDKEFIRKEENFFNLKDDILCPINITDLKLIKDNGATDESIQDSLPSHDPKWWCKVENGFILNLKGEKKNKIAYDYDS